MCRWGFCCCLLGVDDDVLRDIGNENLFER